MPPRKRAAASVQVSGTRDQPAQNVCCPASSTESQLTDCLQILDTATKAAQSTVAAAGTKEDSQASKRAKTAPQRPKANDV